MGGASESVSVEGSLVSGVHVELRHVVWFSVRIVRWMELWRLSLRVVSCSG